MRRQYHYISLVFAFIFSLLLSFSAMAEQGKGYLFSADRVAYDQNYKIIVAVGDVEIATDTEILKADTATIYEEEERIEASGNVSLTDREGNTFFTDTISFTDEGNNIFTAGIKALMSDQSRLTGASGKRIDGKRTEVNKAMYSPCEACQENPNADPPWQLKASKVIHDQENKTMIYRNARMEMWGVPVLWTPYFAHPDPSVKQKSGFLRPSYGFKSDLGTLVGGSYYWAMAPDKDATFGLRWTTKQGPVGDVEYRQRFEKGELALRGSLTQSDRVTQYGAIREDRVRGHLEGRLNYHIDDQWRAGFNIFRASDEQYARLYDYSDGTIFENRLYAERFDDRDFTSLELYAFQDIRLNQNIDQPAILPWLEHDMYGKANGLLGGRWHLNGSLLGVDRNSGQDTTRMALLADWQRSFLSDYGLKADVLLSTNYDLYYLRDRMSINPNLDSTSFASRFYPQAHTIVRYPLVNRFDDKNLMIEPIASISAGSLIDENDNGIANEDSNDILFDWTNLFDPNRFPGLDRVEDGSRVTYGLNAALYQDNGYRFGAFMGQSYRITDDNIFPNGSGLEEEYSHYVGGVQVSMADRFNLDYGFQLDDENFSSRRHEIRASTNVGPFRGQVSYFFDRSVAGSGLNTEREQIEPAFSIDLNDQWRVSGAALYDLSTDQDGLIEARGHINYALDCMSVGLGVARNLIDRASGESELEFLLTLGFKNLGNFEGPSFSINEERHND